MLSLVDTNQETRVLSPLPVSKAASQRDLSVVSTSEPHMHAESAVHFKLPVTQAEAALRNLFTGKAATPRKASNDVTKATNAPAQNKEKTSWLQDTAPEAPAPSPDQSRPSAVSWLQDEPKHTVSTARAQSAKPTWLGADDTAHTLITPTATSAVPAARTSAHARTDAASPLSSESARQTRAFSAQTRDAVAVSKHTGSSSGWTIPKSRRDNERLLEDLVMEQYRSILGAAQVRLSRLSFYHAQANILIFDLYQTQDSAARTAPSPKPDTNISTVRANPAQTTSATLNDLIGGADSHFDLASSLKAEQKYPLKKVGLDKEESRPRAGSAAVARVTVNTEVEGPPVDPLMQSFITPNLPTGLRVLVGLLSSESCVTGRNLVISITSTWGDKHYVGLTGIEVHQF